MCDYCDCRSHPAIASLSDDHDVLTGLMTDLRGAVDAADDRRARTVLLRLHHELDRHARQEEEGVFRQLRGADVDGAYVDMFERDHERIHRLIAECDRDPAGATGSLVGDLHEHILREETDLFPAAHQLLSPDQWDEVDAVHDDARSRS